MWHRVAVGVMKRPVAVALAGITLLLAVGIPFFGVEFGVPDDRVLPENDPARVTSEILRSDFTSAEADAFPIVATGGTDATATASYAAAVSALDGVARVDAATGRYAEGRQVAPVDPTLARFDGGPDATWLSGILEPYALTVIGSSRLALARPVRRPPNSCFRTFIAPVAWRSLGH